MSESDERLATPAWVTPVLVAFEGMGFFEEMELTGRIGRVVRENQLAPDVEKKAALAEFSAFGFQPLDLDKMSRWGTHFAEHFSHEKFLEPDVASVDAAVLAYWHARMGEVKHPILKARYADVLWDLSKAAGAPKSPIDAARIAADSYAAIGPLALDRGAMIRAGDRLARGLQIALQIKDPTGRIEAARDALFALYERFDHTAGWMTLFKTFDYFPKVPLTTDQRDRMTAGLERHITDISSRPQGAQPIETLPVAAQLAAYYRKVSREEDARRVVRASGQAVERAAATASSAALAYAWLEMAYGFFRDSGLKEDAQRVLLACRQKGEETLAQMPTTTVTYTFSEEEIASLEAGRKRVIGGTLEQALYEIALGFIPDIARCRELLAEWVRTSPIFGLTGTSQMREGQTVGRAGAPSTDPDGALVVFLRDQISLRAGQLGWLLDSIREKFDVTTDALVDYLYGSVVFATEFRPLIREGIDAYLKGDQVKALSVLVPQIENALRRLLRMLGQPPNKAKRGGTMTEKTLNDLLEHEPELRRFLGEDVNLYLLTFLADGRGQNLRNRISHGLKTAEEFHRGYSDRVLHILLVLAGVRPGECAPTPILGDDKQA